MPDWLAILCVWVAAIVCIAIAYFAGRYFNKVSRRSDLTP